MVAAAVAAGTGALPTIQLPGDRPSADVELVADDTVPSGAPLSDEERARVLAPFDPANLRCEPRGCEAWRVETDGGDPGHPNGEVGRFGDLVVVAGRDRIDAHDLDTGEHRWSTSWPARADVRPRQAWTLILTADEERLVLVRPESGEAIGLDRDGTLAWHHVSERPAYHALVAGGVVVTAGHGLGSDGHLDPGDVEDPTGDVTDDVTDDVTGGGEDDAGDTGYVGERLTAIDATDGTVRWTRNDLQVSHSSQQALLAHDGDRHVRLDPGTGEVVADLPVSADAWISFGDGTTVFVTEPDLTHHVLDAETLEVLATIDDATELTPVLGEEAFVGLGGPADDDAADADASPVLRLYEADGRLRWERPLPDELRSRSLCCPQPRRHAGALVLATQQMGNRSEYTLAFDADTGEPVPTVADLLPGMPESTWWLSPDLAIDHRPERLRLWFRGTQVTVHGDDVWPVNLEPPLLVTNGRTLMRLDLEAVAEQQSIGRG
ncbi:hypothetical protein GCM10011354_25340 [Egicoccus halophilus]|uniref:Pyrrolo-quinoline quinone repeat domain-containing protein n=1 Tax=Egicoccus halophilus TaxID=1670830 RepID=A0A8J3AGD2_9ACTN|nr:hypothetical protein GCM10011354_25340 [Egicoccus halophilus]